LVLTIQAGEGGQDSRNFVHELFSAYAKYAKSKKLEVEIIESSESKISAEITGKVAWESYKDEAGKHCVQRVPPTESGGRRHTSLVSVAVMPLREEKNYSPLPSNEVEITATRGTGPGGQHRNKTDSAIRAVHKKTKIQVFIDGRDQHTNKRKAIHILTARVRESEWDKKSKEYNEERKVQMGGGGRGDKVRTYNFIDKFVMDHKTGKETNKIKKIMKGQFGLVK